MPSLVRQSFRLGFLVAMLGLPLSDLAAQSGSIQGQVVDSAGAPVVGAIVTVDRTSLGATTTASGRYTLHGVPARMVTLTVHAIGFAAASSSVTVIETDVVEVNFTLNRSPVELAPIDVVVGSRAHHTAAEELAVPVDVYTAEDIQQQGTTETSQVLQTLSPSVNFPRQSVTDANDIVRPFTLRGLSPDHTLVLVNGWRRHQMAVLNTFAYGMGAGSSGVDLNAIPGGAIDRIEVLRDGASAQYGSDAIAGVVNIVMKEGKFSPFLNVDAGRFMTDNYPDDGTLVDLNGGVGIGIGRGSLGIFGEYQHRDPTNRAWPDSFLVNQQGIGDLIDPKTGEIIEKRNSLPQPNYHWGDGLEKDAMTFGNFRLPLNQSGTTEFYAFGGYSNRVGSGNGFWRYFDSNRNWQELYPQGFLPEFHPHVDDYSAAGGIRTNLGGWGIDFGVSWGMNTFDYDLENTNNPSLGPCLDVACAPGADGILGNGDDPGVPNQTSFFAGRLQRSEVIGAANVAKAVDLGLAKPVNFAFGGAIRGENYQIQRGEFASYVNGGHAAQDSVANPGDLSPGGSSVFAGFRPADEADESRTNVGVYGDVEANITSGLLANIAGRYENYSDFGSRVTGKLALRLQPTKRFVIRGAASTGFRAPGLAQSFFSHVTTNVIGGQFQEIGNFPVNNHAAEIFGAKPLQEETATNLSAGIVVSPSDNFTITADYFHIKIDNRILLGATFNDSVSQAILADSGFTGIAGVQFFTNGLDTKTEGVDFTADWVVPAGQGTFDLNLGVNYTKNTITHVDPLPPILQGTPTTIPSVLDLVTQVGIEEERPDWRSTLQATYSIGRFHTLGRVNYFGGFASAQPSFTDREEYGSKTLFDLELGYRFDQMNLSIGARNLFDTYPDQPKAEFNNNDNTFPWAAASPFGYNGRFIYTRAELILGW